VNASSLERGIGMLALFFALGIVPVAGGIRTATAAEESNCTDSSAPCQAEEGEGEDAADAAKIDMFVRARQGYSDARKSGDFTEPLKLSRQLAAQGSRAGKGLLRMIYMQLGLGAHKDYVQAYVWLSEGMAADPSNLRKGATESLVRWRKRLEEKMTPDQIAQAKTLSGS